MMTATGGGDPPRQLFGVPEMREFAESHEDERVKLMMRRIDTLLSKSAKWCESVNKLELELARLRDATRWRSVDEGLPKEKVRVWCFDPRLRGYAGFYDDGTWWDASSPWTDRHPTHWQPLPEPPQ